MVAPVVTVMAVEAKMFPAKMVAVPMVAAVPTIQYTSHADAPLVRTTLDPEMVVRVVASWKT